MESPLPANALWQDDERCWSNNTISLPAPRAVLRGSSMAVYATWSTGILGRYANLCGSGVGCCSGIRIWSIPCNFFYRWMGTVTAALWRFARDYGFIEDWETLAAEMARGSQSRTNWKNCSMPEKGFRFSAS